MGLNLFPKYSNVEYMALENAECVRFWWEAGALHDVQIWFNYRIYSQGWCWCLSSTSISVFGDVINNLISKILWSKLILHSCSYQYTIVCFPRKVWCFIFALNETFGSSSNIVFVNEILKMVDLSGYIMLLAEEQGVPKLFGIYAYFLLSFTASFYEIKYLFGLCL